MTKPAVQFTIHGAPKTKENKGQFNKRSFYFKKYPELVQWEVDVNAIAIEAMRTAGFTGPYKGRVRIQAIMTFESWKRCDVTNYWKSLNDALNGAVYLDDSQVDVAECVRRIDRHHPSIEVKIYFYDLSFDESFKTPAGKMKYPDQYREFDINGGGCISHLRPVQKPEDAPAKRYGVFVVKTSKLDETPATKKVPQNKVNRSRRKPNDSKKKEVGVRSVNGTNRKCNEQAGTTGTRRRRVRKTPTVQ